MAIVGRWIVRLILGRIAGRVIGWLVKRVIR